MTHLGMTFDWNIRIGDLVVATFLTLIGYGIRKMYTLVRSRLDLLEDLDDERVEHRDLIDYLLEKIGVRENAPERRRLIARRRLKAKADRREARFTALLSEDEV